MSVNGDERRYLYFYDLNQSANKIYSNDSSMKNIHYIFDGLVIYSRYNELNALDLSDVTANNLTDGVSTKISDSFSEDSKTFYKDGKLYFLQEDGNGQITFCSYDLKTKPENPEKLADLNALGVSSDAETLAMNDKYALVSDKGELSLIVYGDSETTDVTIKPVNKRHLNKYIGESYTAFVDPELSNGIVLSVEKENAVYFYSIGKKGDLASVGKTDMITDGVQTNNSLVYEIDKESETFKVYEIVGE